MRRNPSKPAHKLPVSNPLRQPAPKQNGGTDPTRATSTMLLQRLEMMDSELSSSPAYTGAARWMIPYADIMTLLIGLFIVLAMSSQYALQELTKQEASPSISTTPKETTASTMLTLVEPGAVEVKNIPGVEQTASHSPADPQVEMAVQNWAERLKETLQQTTPDASGALVESVDIGYQSRGVVISLREKILFQPGEATLSPAAKATLNELAKTLKTIPNQVQIEGHTDNSPIATSQFPSNWELSTARATVILQYLIESRKMAPQRFSAVGYGEYRPVAANTSETGRQKNRRVDVVILNQEDSRQNPEASDLIKVKEFHPDPP